MKRLIQYVANHRARFAIGGSILVFVGALLVYRLGTLTTGLSIHELAIANTPIGWHGIYDQPFYLPLLFLRSVVFFLINDYGNFLLRLPNIFFGLLAVVSFAFIIKRWHGTRTAFFATSLFATSAWFLHASRLASFDVLYICAIPLLFASGMLLQKHTNKAIVFYGSLLIWGTLLYVPGLIWLIALTLFWQKGAIAEGWKHFSKVWQRLLYIAGALVWLPLLIVNLTRPNQFVLWLGAPDHFATPLLLIKQFFGVFMHLFIRGPQYPEIWLDKVPILDVFVLISCIVGIYFYISHYSAFRSKQLLSYFVVSVLLVAVHGPASLSLLVPLMYIIAATGIAYLLREWLQVFPRNPFARGLGITLISIAVALSCVYNLRAYFVAWPHNQVTQATFRYHR